VTCDHKVVVACGLLDRLEQELAEAVAGD